MIKSGKGIITEYDPDLFVGTVLVNDEPVAFYITGFLGRAGRNRPMIGRKVGISYQPSLTGKLWAVSVTEIADLEVTDVAVSI